MTALERLLGLCERVLADERRLAFRADDGSVVSLAEIMGEPPDHAPDLARGVLAFVRALEKVARPGREFDLRRFTDETVSNVRREVDRILAGEDDEE